MTSNVGSDTIKKAIDSGLFLLSTTRTAMRRWREKILDEAKKTFRPEVPEPFGRYCGVPLVDQNLI